MEEQGAILYLNEDEEVWELITVDNDEPEKIWENEENALRDLEKDGWKIEGPFEMCPKNEELPQLWFTGYGLMRSIH